IVLSTDNDNRFVLTTLASFGGSMSASSKVFVRNLYANACLTLFSHTPARLASNSARSYLSIETASIISNYFFSSAALTKQTLHVRAAEKLSSPKDQHQSNWSKIEREVLPPRATRKSSVPGRSNSASNKAQRN